jgi:hypothetical protein
VFTGRKQTGLASRGGTQAQHPQDGGTDSKREIKRSISPGLQRCKLWCDANFPLTEDKGVSVVIADTRVFVCNFRSSIFFIKKFSEQVSRIARHRQVPRHIKTAREELRTIKESRARKEANRRRHAKPGSVPYVPEREKHIVDEKE